MVENRRIYLDEDVQLMLRVAESDEDAFNILYGKFFRIVADYATSRNGHCNSSEDIANEVFERVWAQRAEYQPTSALKTYLFTFAGNVISEYQRRCWYQESMLNSYSKIVPAEQPAADIAVQYEELIEIVEKAKSKLSKKQRQAMEFAFYSNISINEAAKLAGCSYMVFCSRIKDAKKRLAVLLKQFRDY
ncbi:MAG: RNA polymerase sigma factor [Planctomycetota bacterium]|jgi:RNA polymerase sigma-70 factor (ECF subfamily)